MTREAQLARACARLVALLADDAGEVFVDVGCVLGHQRAQEAVDEARAVLALVVSDGEDEGHAERC